MTAQALLKNLEGYVGADAAPYVYALGVAVLAYLVLGLASWVVRKRLARLAESRETYAFGMAAGAAAATRQSLLFLLALYLGAAVLEVPPKAREWLQALLILILVIQMCFWAGGALRFFSEKYTGDNLTDQAARVTTMRALLFVVRVVMYSIALVIVLDNIPGVEVTTLIAGLGIGGIAVALALQNLLSDVFASLSISLDKPFVLGDFIMVGDMLGIVENIGLKTTRVRSLSGEQLIFANNDLLNSRIPNYKRSTERREPFVIGITYDTPRDRVEAIPGAVREIIENAENARFDRAHFKAYGAYSLDFEIVYYVLTPDYATYMDVQQHINLEIHRYFEQQGIEFAYPTQTLFLHRHEAGGGNPSGSDG